MIVLRKFLESMLRGKSRGSFFALGIKSAKKKQVVFRGAEEEEVIYELVRSGVSDQDELALRANLGGAQIAGILTMLELGGYIRPLGAGNWAVA